MPRPSYPFPSKKPGAQLPSVIPYPTECSHEALPRLTALLDQDEYRSARLRYLTIEEELERAYRYVAPCGKNADAFSFKFADVIRAAAGAYEIQCKRLYTRFYNDSDHIDIYNYLAIDRFLWLAQGQVKHLLAMDSFGGYPEVHQPFANLATWDRNSLIDKAHVPGWWRAYNSVKHDDEGVENAATLANATAALAALFLLTETVYGGGILAGGRPRFQRLRCCLREDGQGLCTALEVGNLYVELPRWSRLFGHQKHLPALTLLEEVPAR